MANDMNAGGRPEMPMRPQSGGAPGGAPGAPPSIDALIVQLDQGLTTVADMLGRANPEAGEAMAALNEQYRKIITSVIEQAGGGAPREEEGGYKAPVNAQQGTGGVPSQF